jgi:peptide-methionine (S)-S-oxide reductase
METATFGAGCFWGVQSSFDKIDGVDKTTVGFMGGNIKNPTYDQVCKGKTGHVEVVNIEFDQNVIKYNELLNVFWNIHDPTQFNRQGFDIGSQYKSIIFFYSEEQKYIAEQSKKKLGESNIYNKDIITEIKQASVFYPAEEYHQKYFEKMKYKK